MKLIVKNDYRNIDLDGFTITGKLGDFRLNTLGFYGNKNRGCAFAKPRS